MKQQVEREYTVELENGKQVDGCVVFTAIYDSNYGADADGNRGMGVWIEDELEAIVYDEDLSAEEIAEAKDLLMDRAESADINYNEVV